MDYFIQQYKNHTKTLSTGDKAVRIQRNLWDIFQGEGWKDHTRIRIRDNPSGIPNITVLLGNPLSQSDRYYLCTELLCK